MNREIIHIDNKHRVLLEKRFFNSGYAWDASVQKKVRLLGWYTVQRLLDGWDYLYGLTHDEAVEKAERAKKNILDSI